MKRQAVQNRLDIFDGLILDLDPKAQQQHMERKHPNLAHSDATHQCEFMPIYEKHKRTMGDNWGLEGVERDTQKVYKYAKENFSRAKKNERNAVVTPATDTGESSSEAISSDYMENKKREVSFPQPITPPDSDTASISPNKPSSVSTSQHLPSMPISSMYPVVSSEHTDHTLHHQMSQIDQTHDFHLDWTQPPVGFSFRSLLEDNSTPWFNNNVKDAQISYQGEKRPFEHDPNYHNAKVRRVDRCADPELKKLRCGIGGSYRFSLSKLHFNRISCPYCVAPANDRTGKQSKVWIKAEYWRRHVTEVHSKPEEVAETKNLTICLTCYNQSMCNSKDEQNVDKPLQDFDALFRNQQEQQNHVHTVHNGAANIEFTSVWDKKEAQGAMIPSHPPIMTPSQSDHPALKYGNMANYQYYQSYPTPYQPYYRQAADPYSQSTFGFNQHHHFNPNQIGQSLIAPDTPASTVTTQSDTGPLAGYDFYQNQNVQPTYHAAQQPSVPATVSSSVKTEEQTVPRFEKTDKESSVSKTNDSKDKKCDEKLEKGKPRYNSIVFANEF